MSKIFEQAVKNVPNEVKRFVDHSFDIVDQIYDILVRQGKTQRDLAKMLGKKESEISKWMQGTHNFTIKSLAKIEDVLGEEIITTPKKSQKKMTPVPVFVRTKKLQAPNIDSGKWANTQPKIFSGNKGLKVA
jgi:transcriptional regulator with XRE-family HTH domain